MPGYRYCGWHDNHVLLVGGTPVVHAGHTAVLGTCRTATVVVPGILRVLGLKIKSGLLMKVTNICIMHGVLAVKLFGFLVTFASGYAPYSDFGGDV